VLNEADAFSDGHVDFPLVVRALFGNRIYNPDFSEPFENGDLKSHVDLKRLRDGQSGGAFWSVYAPCPANYSDFSDENYASSKLDSQEGSRT
jgi:membrane dipeptidase